MMNKYMPPESFDDDIFRISRCFLCFAFLSMLLRPSRGHMIYGNLLGWAVGGGCWLKKYLFSRVRRLRYFHVIR